MSLEQKTKISQAKKGHSCFLKPKKTYKKFIWKYKIDLV
jgi:hypothetical protein